MQQREGKSGGIGLSNALAGLAVLSRTQKNARIHAAATVAVLALGGLLPLSASEWIWIVLAVGMVWTGEALNTAIELLADAAVPEWHPQVGRAKDVAAGGVLVSAATAAVIGTLVFGPHLLGLIGVWGWTFSGS